MSKQLEVDDFYRFVIKTFHESGIPFLIGGTHAFAPYTGITRNTKDLDIFIYRKDCARALTLFSDLGFKTEMHFSHWIAKIYSGDYLVDLIFSSGNGLCEVDDEWFENAIEGETLGIPVRWCPPEEIIWQKSFIMEHLRYDGADIAHIIYACADHIDWARLLQRFGPHWRVFFTHLILFGYIYPNEREKIPDHLMHILLNNLKQEIETEANKEAVCQGTYLSLLEYMTDLKDKSYFDARLKPRGNMTQEEIDEFTRAFTKST